MLPRNPLPAVLSALLLAGCAAPELTNLTPATVARTPSGLYPLRAAVEPKGNDITYVHALINDMPWPMMPVADDEYAVGYFAAACDVNIPYQFAVGYRRRNVIGSGYSSRVHVQEFPEAGGFVMSIEGDTPPSCSGDIGYSFVVTTTADAVDALPGDGECRTAAGECSLRAAIMESNASAGHDQIRVPAGNYVLSLRGSEATDTPDASVNDLDITGGVTLRGDTFAARNESLNTVFDAGALDRIFDIYTPLTQFVNLGYLRLENGRAVNSGGGAIWNRGNLRMERLALLENRIAHDISYSCGASVSTRICNRGGGLLNEGQALLLRSTVRGNSTGDRSGRAGGISNLGASARLFLRDSLIHDNDARFNGGLANYAGHVEISNTTFADNQSTTSGSRAHEVGNYDGTVNARNATFRNTGILFGHNGAGDITIANSLVNIDSFREAPVCSGELQSGGFNVIAGPSGTIDYLRGCGYTPNRLDRTDVRISLPGLSDNGGPTRTIPLFTPAAGSPLFSPIDFGGVLCPDTDQRGFLRDDGNCDAGAYEH